MDGVHINLKTNPFIYRFFMGWDPLKAASFAQNLLILGIGVVFKQLNGDNQEDILVKSNQMAEQIIAKHDDIGYSQQIALRQNKRKEKNFERKISRKRLSSRNQQQESFNFREIDQPPFNSFREQSPSHSLKQLELLAQVNYMKKQLETLNSKLSEQQDSQSEENQGKGIKINSQSLLGEDLILDQDQSRLRGRYATLASKITPKITSSPPPFQNAEMKRNTIRNNRTHLSGDSVKQCLRIQGDDLYQNMYIPQSQSIEEAYYDSYQQRERYSESTPINNNNNYLKENSGSQNDLATNKFQSRSPQRINEQLLHQNLEANLKQKTIANLNRRYLHQNGNGNFTQEKERIPKKEKSNNFVAKSNVDPFQDTSRKNAIYSHVESRIKYAIQADKEQHTNTNEKEREGNKPQPIDFRKILKEEKKEEDFSKTPKNNSEDITFEMGVQFSRDAQKKFYEKKKEEDLKKQQMVALQNGFSQKYETLNQNDPNQYREQQQQQFYSNLQQLEQLRQDSLQSQPSLKSEDQFRIQMNSQEGPENGKSPTSQRAALAKKKNILDIAKQFLSNPLIRSLNENGSQSYQFVEDNEYYNYQEEEENDQRNINNFPSSSQLKSQQQFNPFSNFSREEEYILENQAPSYQDSQEEFFKGPPSSIPSMKMFEDYRQPNNYQNIQMQQQNGVVDPHNQGVNPHYYNYQSKRNQKQQMQPNNLPEAYNKRENLYNHPDYKQLQSIEMEARQSGFQNKKGEDIFKGNQFNYYQEEYYLLFSQKESVSDFTMLNEEIQQFFKNQNFNIK